MIDDIRLPLSEWTARHNRWADMEVEEILNPDSAAIPGGSGDPVAEKRSQRSFYYRQPLFLRAFLLFLYRYVWKRGFLDGTIGLTVSALNAYYVFLKFAKLWELDHACSRSTSTPPVAGGADRTKSS